MPYKDRKKRNQHGREYARKNREYYRLYALGVKLEVVSYYGKNGKPQCCWEGCVVNDVDMLTIDHINNDGYKENPSQRAGMGLYHKLRKENFPSGYQTLCSNHQLKKETLRRRSEGRREYKIKE